MSNDYETLIDRNEHNFDRKNIYAKGETIYKEKKIGRNERCPCGSGKKYKKCCIDK